MTWLYVPGAPDDLTIVKRSADMPDTVWVQDAPGFGHKEPITVQNAPDWGWFELIETPQPTADHVRSIEMAPGNRQLRTAWTFDQARADQNADEAARNLDRAELVNDFALAQTERDDAAQERSEMTVGDPAFLNKWTDVDQGPTAAQDTSGSAAVKADRALAAIDLINARLDDQARMLNLHTNKLRKMWGNFRQINAVFVRLFRADRHDTTE